MNAPDLRGIADTLGGAERVEAQFAALADALQAALRGGERYTATLEAESSDFVRLNRGKVRQAGHVGQSVLSLRLVDGARHAEHELTLTGDHVRDVPLALAALRGLRDALPDVVDDPHLSLPDTVTSTRDVRLGELPPSEQVIEEVLGAGRDTDLVGIYAAGPVYRAFANSEGQRNWHAIATFNLDWSLYHAADKAVKAAYAGFAWSNAALVERMVAARERLRLIALPPRTLAPGNYRAWLAPAAMEEVTSLLRWGAFSGRALATQQSALVRMKSEERLDPRVTIAEDFASGIAPRFQAEGFARPVRVPLIEAGRLGGALVASRTAREFGIEGNGANRNESPEALSMDGGALAAADTLAALDTGLYVGNLWYLNYSDRPACRMTGMTRFATFWVEGGRIVAPLNVMRFDDSLFRMLGSNLEALSREPELMLSPESYGSRQLVSARLPGALVRGMAFTL